MTHSSVGNRVKVKTRKPDLVSRKASGTNSVFQSNSKELLGQTRVMVEGLPNAKTTFFKAILEKYPRKSQVQNQLHASTVI